MTEPTRGGNYGWDAGPMRLIPTPLSATSATDAYTRAATEMALVHNCLIRGLNSIYLQAPHIPPHLYNPFVSYSLAVYQCLEAYHIGEGHPLFSEIVQLTGEESIMDENIAQRRAFQTGALTWGKWLTGILKHKNNFSPDMCRSLMDDFLFTLQLYLADEVPTIFALSRFGDKIDIMRLKNKEGQDVIKELSKTVQLPTLLYNHDITYEGGIHKFPLVKNVTGLLLIRICARRKSAWWRFASCTHGGKPKRLEFETKV